MDSGLGEGPWAYKSILAGRSVRKGHRGGSGGIDRGVLYLVGRKEVRREKKEGFEKCPSEGMPELGNCVDLEGRRRGDVEMWLPWKRCDTGRSE